MFKSLNSKLAIAGATVAAAVPAFASDPTPFDTALTSIQTGMTDTIGKVVPVVAAVVVAAIGLWAIPFAWRKLRGGAGR